MGDKTGIEWTDATWNPVRGCSRVSEGCRHCYAERTAARFSGPGQPYYGLATSRTRGSKWTGEVRLIHDRLADPLRWRKPRRVFVNSMSDLFHEKLADKDIDHVFGVMAACQYLGRHAVPGHTFQVLTKRPARMLEYFSPDRRKKWAYTGAHIGGGEDGDPMWDQIAFGPLALPNVWLGVSTENQATADERIPLLLETPAAKRFISYEPALGPIELRRFLPLERSDSQGRCLPARSPDWVIAGAESGPRARPADLDWYRSVRDQCAAAGVAFFLKQHVDGGAKVSLPILDGERHAEFPQ